MEQYQGNQRKLLHWFFRYQLVVSQFQNLNLFGPEEKMLAFQIFSFAMWKMKISTDIQLKYKKKTKDIGFYDQTGNEEKYFTLR